MSKIRGGLHVNNDDLMKELNKTLNNISLDIRQIMTTLGHFEEKFKGTQKDIESIRESTKDNQEDVQELTLKVNTIKTENVDTKKDVEILFDKFKHRDKKSDNDRKWIIGTVISVVLMFVAVASLALTLIGG